MTLLKIRPEASQDPEETLECWLEQSPDGKGMLILRGSIGNRPSQAIIALEQTPYGYISARTFEIHEPALAKALGIQEKQHIRWLMPRAPEG